jgi:hypothetical protein
MLPRQTRQGFDIEDSRIERVKALHCSHEDNLDYKGRRVR